MKSVVKNAADAQQVKEGADKERRGRKQELSDLESVLSSPAGRRLIWRVINHICHYDRDDAQASGSLTYYSLGERNVGRLIKSDAYEASVENCQLMERENWPLLKGED